MRVFFGAIAILFSCASIAQDIAGRWTTVDDNSGAERSIVEITVAGGKATGRIIDLDDKTKLEHRCEVCKDDRKGKRIIGLEIIRNMVRDGEEWSGGTILDPENGNIYPCKMWLQEGKLKVRGYVGFFFRTQEWIR